MDNILDVFNQYVRSELAVLVPVLYFLMKFLAQSKLNNARIPLVLCLVSVSLCGIYTFASAPISSVAAGFMCVFTSITQGVLYAGATMFGGMLISGGKSKPQ